MDILEFLKEYGVGGIIGLAIGGGLYVLWQSYVKYIFKKLYDRYDTRHDIRKEKNYLDNRKKALQSQEFFPNIKFKMNVDIPSEDFSTDEGRRCLYKNIMLALFESYYNNMIEFSRGLDTSWDNNEWANSLNSVNYKIIEDFRANCAQREIPKDVVKYFIIWFTPIMKQIYFYVKKISAMNNKNSIENTNTYFLLLELILMNTLSDIKNFDMADNHLEGLEYKGKIIDKFE